MANPEHVAVAKGRSFAIARWRARSFQTRAHLDLSGAYLSGLRMPGVDLSHDNLDQIDLTSADLPPGHLQRRSTAAGLPDALQPEPSQL